MKKIVYFVPLILILIGFIAFYTVYTMIQYNSFEYISVKIWGEGDAVYSSAPKLPAKSFISYNDLSDRTRKFIGQEEIRDWVSWMDIWGDFKKVPKGKAGGKLSRIEQSKSLIVGNDIIGFVEVFYKYDLIKGWKIDYINVDFPGEDE